MNYMGNRGPARDSKGSEGAEASSAAPPLLGAASCLWALSGAGVQSSLHPLVMGITQNTQAWGCFHHGLPVAAGLGQSPQIYGHACLHALPVAVGESHHSMEVPVRAFLLESIPSQSQLPATSSHVGKETNGNPKKWHELSGALAVLLPADGQPRGVTCQSWEAGSVSP